MPSSVQETVIRPLMIVALVGSVAYAVAELINSMAPDWGTGYLFGASLFAAVEACYSQRLLYQRKLRGSDLRKFRLVELAFLFLLIRFGSYLVSGPAALLQDLQRLPREPITLLLDPLPFVAFGLAFLAWNAASQTMMDLLLLNEHPTILAFSGVPAPGTNPAYAHLFQSTDQTFRTTNAQILDRLRGRFFWGGALLLVAVGLTHVSVSELLDLQRPSVPGLVFNALLYFLLGLVLFGQVRLSALRLQWHLDGTIMESELPRRWLRYSLTFIGLAACIAFLLPTGFTSGLLASAAYALDTITVFVWFIVTFLLFLLTYPVIWLIWQIMSRLVEDIPPLPPPEPPPLELPQQPPAMQGSESDWLAIIRFVLFWIALTAFALYVARLYLRDHPDVLRALLKTRPVRWLVGVWSWLLGSLGRLTTAAREGLPLLLTRRANQGSSQPRNRFFRLGGRSPREQIIFYYLSLLRRANEKGIPREGSQTPYEYEARLEPNLPDAHEDVRQLTNAFVEARYSRHTVEPGMAQLVREKWNRVKAALRRARDGSARE